MSLSFGGDSEVTLESTVVRLVTLLLKVTIHLSWIFLWAVSFYSLSMPFMFVSSSQVWSVCLRRSFWSPRYPDIWLNNTTTAPPMVTTHMSSTNAQRNTLSTEDLPAHPAPAPPDLTTHTFNITISSSIISTMTTSMGSCRGNTSADAASNVCKGT